jgi:hypothetical protein
MGSIEPGLVAEAERAMTADLEPPRVYDIHTDETRAATQNDVNVLNNAAAALGMLRHGLRALLDVTLEVQQGRRPPADLAAKIRSLP